MLSWSAIKKRIRSKTYHAATYLMGVGIVVDQYTPEIKQAIAEKVGVSWGVVYAVAFAVAMYALREVTKAPLEEKGDKNAESKHTSDRDGQELDDSRTDCGLRCSGGMDLWDECEKQADGAGESSTCGDNQDQGRTAGDAKPRSGAKRRKRRKAARNAHQDNTDRAGTRSGVPGNRKVEGQQ